MLGREETELWIEVRDEAGAKQGREATAECHWRNHLENPAGPGRVCLITATTAKHRASSMVLKKPSMILT